MKETFLIEKRKNITYSTILVSCKRKINREICDCKKNYIVTFFVIKFWWSI